jgi:acyl-CoA reductase-like NAD-dependent aldehyde dehydrogenase
MEHAREFYIDGRWVQRPSPSTLAVINPASEAPIASFDDLDWTVMVEPQIGVVPRARC